MREKAWVYTGSTIEEATRIALEELGLERDDIHVEILEEEQKGFLGIGGKGANVRVELIGEWEVLGKRDTEEEEEETETYDVSLEQDKAPTSNTVKPVEMVEDILAIMGVDAMVDAEEKKEAVVIDIWGEDVAILIGKEGKTLNSLQYLVNVSCRRRDEVSKRISVDIEGYTKRRISRLEKEALQLAEKAVLKGKSIELPPMNPSERKVIHVALRGFDGVWTESEGDDRDRRVVIHPEKA